jgi:uncharacterized protein
MAKAVLDSSVLVSAFLTPGGTSDKLLSAVQRGAFMLCLSQEILRETSRSLREKTERIRRYYAYPDEKIDQFAASLASMARLVCDLPELRVVPLDRKDDVIVATAIAAKAEYLVSGDRHLLMLGAYEDIRIITPRQFLDLLQAPGVG